MLICYTNKRCAINAVLVAHSVAYRVTCVWLWVLPDPVITIVSPSGIPQPSHILCFIENLPPSGKKEWNVQHCLTVDKCALIPGSAGTISAKSNAFSPPSAPSPPPSNTIESGRDGGAQAVWQVLPSLWNGNMFLRHSWEAPHVVEQSPAGVACHPRDTSVEGRSKDESVNQFHLIKSPTNDQPPPRQKGKAVTTPWLRQRRDGAGIGGRK